MRSVRKGTEGFMQFVGKQDTCSNCSEVVEFDEADARRAKEHDDQREGRSWTITWKCPTCSRTNYCTVYKGNNSSYWDDH